MVIFMSSVVIARALHNTCNIFWITWTIVNFLSILKIYLSVSLHFFSLYSNFLYVRCGNMNTCYNEFDVNCMFIGTKQYCFIILIFAITICICCSLM